MKHMKYAQQNTSQASCFSLNKSFVFKKKKIYNWEGHIFITLQIL